MVICPGLHGELKMKTIKAIKITRPYLDPSGYILLRNEIKNLIPEIDVMFDCDKPGDKVCVELIEISQEKYDKLEEFAGW